MKFVSTCKTKTPVTFEHTLRYPIPSPGHLWMPEQIPTVIFPEKGVSLKEHIHTVMSSFVPEIWEREMLDTFPDPAILIRSSFRGRTLHE